MSEFLIFVIAMLLVALIIKSTSSAEIKGQSTKPERWSRKRIRVCGKVSEPAQKDGKPAHSYIIVGQPQHKNGKFGNPEEFVVSRIDYAQMNKNTEVDLLFNSAGKYEMFKLIKANVPVDR